MPAQIKEKKSKVKQFNHAKDNAVSALGKIIRHQAQTSDVNALVGGWVNLLPLKNDLEESKIQNEIFSQLLTECPTFVMGEQYERFEKVILILSDILDKKYVDENTGRTLASFTKQMANDANLGSHFKTIYDNKLS